jgi:hypothetical protein
MKARFSVSAVSAGTYFSYGVCIGSPRMADSYPSPVGEIAMSLRIRVECPECGYRAGNREEGPPPVGRCKHISCLKNLIFDRRI